MKTMNGEFCGGLVSWDYTLPLPRAQVQSPAWEVRSHKLHSKAKKKRRARG